MTLGELITALVDIDLSDPTIHDHEVTVESEDGGLTFWIIVGSHRLSSQ